MSEREGGIEFTWASKKEKNALENISKITGCEVRGGTEPIRALDSICCLFCAIIS